MSQNALFTIGKSNARSNYWLGVLFLIEWQKPNYFKVSCVYLSGRGRPPVRDAQRQCEFVKTSKTRCHSYIFPLTNSRKLFSTPLTTQKWNFWGSDGWYWKIVINVKIGCVIFCSKNLCTHTISVKIVLIIIHMPRVLKNIGICIASILYIGELFTGYATRNYGVWTLFFNSSKSNNSRNKNLYLAAHQSKSKISFVFESQLYF